MGRPRKDKSQPPTDFVCYYRVSSDKQGLSGLGLGAQRSAVAHYTAGKGKILSEHVEIESGKRSDNRPQLIAALAASKRLHATLVIAKLDRLARNVHFISGLMESSADFVACDLPSANRLTLHIMASMAEFEAKQISERTKAGLQVVKAELAEKGFRISPTSKRRFEKLGNPRWEESIAKATAGRKNMQTPERVSLMISNWRTEGKSLQNIADALNEIGIHTAGGHKWYPSSVNSEMHKRLRSGLASAAA